MIEIEMPCCETETLVEDLAETVPCDACGVVLELESATREAVAVAA